MKKKILYTIGTILVISIVAFAYYAISPLFINIKVDDANPSINDSTTTPTESLSVMGTTGHPASGTVRIVESDGKKYIRFENFKTINGPDIYVYLAKDLNAKNYISLGKVKGTEGNINYIIPEGVKTEEYQYVMTWCKQFGVLFNYADISEIFKQQ